MEGRFEDTPFPHPYRASMDMDRNPGAEHGIAPDLVKIDMEDIPIPDIPLGILDKGIVALAIDFHLDDGTF
jgi:hypothetical protein